MNPATWLDSARLQDPEYCDPGLFRSANAGEQKVCDFVLALALAFNDLRDLWWAQDSQLKIPQVEQGRSKHFGLQTGMRMRLLRLYYSNLHEVFKLIHENQDAWGHPLFEKTIRALPGEARASWQALVEIAQGKSSSALRFRRALAKIRNNGGYHYYQIGALGEGFAQHFQGEEPERCRVYVSRGASIQGTRYYFADAAVIALHTKWQHEDDSGVLQEATDEVAGVLSRLVTAFVTARCGSWTPERTR